MCSACYSTKSAGLGPTLLRPNGNGNVSDDKLDDNKATAAVQVSARVRVMTPLNACGLGASHVDKLEAGVKGRVVEIPTGQSLIIRFDNYVFDYEAHRVLKSDLWKLEVLQDPQLAQS